MYIGIVSFDPVDSVSVLPIGANPNQEIILQSFDSITLIECYT